MTDINVLRSQVLEIIDEFSGTASLSANNLTTGDVLDLSLIHI